MIFFTRSELYCVVGLAEDVTQTNGKLGGLKDYYQNTFLIA